MKKRSLETEKQLPTDSLSIGRKQILSEAIQLEKGYVIIIRLKVRLKELVKF